MFSFGSRSQLKGPVKREFDDLITRLKALFLQAHTEDGEHRGVTYSGVVTKITVVNGIVTEVS